MTVKPIDLSGGESVYCINERQLHRAYDLAQEDAQSAPRIQRALKQLETQLSRDEMAALAFVLIDRLLEEAD